MVGGAPRSVRVVIETTSRRGVLAPVEVGSPCPTLPSHEVIAHHVVAASQRPGAFKRFVKVHIERPAETAIPVEFRRPFVLRVLGVESRRAALDLEEVLRRHAEKAVDVGVAELSESVSPVFLSDVGVHTVRRGPLDVDHTAPPVLVNVERDLIAVRQRERFKASGEYRE